MSDGYNGLGDHDKKGCILAALTGVVALIVDFGRFMGDPVPGTENSWWRYIPFTMSTIVVVIATFAVVRAISGRKGR
ncbi:hypothetical protein ASE90_02375 [Sphingomonas sp. Leaf67]|uniref:hypothetical protein n=1 Tax=Sphingomonas sp. Leaf67 TaxID=1736230 RepID=UPI0006F6964A|nr:hypothetical protein [Sphingomonas sp. Leaf67]KQN91660.1 hypothetical protein ASE90_02375 [Sphingomonas sp. Leaf67]